MRQTELRPDKDGYYRRNIGYLRMKGGRHPQPKISLGRNKRAAKERLAKIMAIWSRIAADFRGGDTPAWDNVSLDIAKAIGRGDTVYRFKRIIEDPYHYARLVEASDDFYPEIRIKPDDEDAYREGKEQQALHEDELESVEVQALEWASELRAVVLEEPGNERKYVDLLGDTRLHEAFDAYSKKIAADKYDKSEGAVNDTGVTKQNMIKQLKTYLDDQPLTTLVDFASVDQLFGILRSRPITHRYKKPMARKTANNLMGELAQFLDWLHTSTDWEWRQPEDYHKISRKPLELESDIEHESKEVPTYTVAQLKILFESATPLERLLVLLGINCAYGADQIGRLRIGEIVEKRGRHYIRRVRKKKRVMGVHRLFDITLKGVKWAVGERWEDKKAHVLINSEGNPLWRKTAGGNRSKDIPNAWYRLLDRVQQDRPDFPRLGFNSLRDTSANMIRQIAGQEVASIHLTHRHQSSDRNLRNYTNVPWKKVFQAQRVLEKRLAEVFKLDSDPWQERDHQYVTQAQIKEMKALKKAGRSVAQIAESVGVAKTTVYRWVGPVKKRAKAPTQVQS